MNNLKSLSNTETNGQSNSETRSLSTSEENSLATKAWEEIQMCCQTLCHKEHVVRYIKYLEETVSYLQDNQVRPVVWSKD